MENVYTKRGIKLKLIAQPYGDENPMIDVYYDNPTTGSRQMLATDVEITATDAASPQEVTVTPVTKGGAQYLTVEFKNDHYDEDGDRNVVLVGVDLDENNDVTPDSYNSWVWTEIDYDGVTLTNSNTVFDYVTITHTAPFKIKFDMESVEMFGYSNTEMKEWAAESKVAFTGATHSASKSDCRVTVDGVPTDNFTIASDGVTVPGVKDMTEEVEFVAFAGMTYA